MSSFISCKLSFILQKKLLKQFQSSYSEPGLSAAFEIQSLSSKWGFFFPLQVQTLLNFCIVSLAHLVLSPWLLVYKVRLRLKLWLGSSSVTALILCGHLNMDRSLNDSHSFMKVKLEQNYVDIEL